MPPNLARARAATFVAGLNVFCSQPVAVFGALNHRPSRKASGVGTGASGLPARRSVRLPKVAWMSRITVTRPNAIRSDNGPIPFRQSAAHAFQCAAFASHSPARR